jgi:hypothetical protein
MLDGHCPFVFGIDPQKRTLCTRVQAQTHAALTFAVDAHQVRIVMRKILAKKSLTQVELDAA